MKRKKEEKKEETVQRIAFLTDPKDYVSQVLATFDAGFKIISDIPSIEYRVLQNIQNHEETKIATPNPQEEQFV